MAEGKEGETKALRHTQALVTARPKTPGGPWFVELSARGAPTVYLGPYQNPACAREDAEKVRQFLKAITSPAGG
jgi:hypothetical protein